MTNSNRTQASSTREAGQAVRRAWAWLTPIAAAMEDGRLDTALGWADGARIEANDARALVDGVHTPAATRHRDAALHILGEVGKIYAAIAIARRGEIVEAIEAEGEGDEFPADDTIDAEIVEDIQPHGAPLFLVAANTERPDEVQQVADLDGAINNREVMNLAVAQSEARLEEISETIDKLNQEREFLRTFHLNALNAVTRMDAEIKNLRFA